MLRAVLSSRNVSLLDSLSVRDLEWDEPCLVNLAQELLTRLTLSHWHMDTYYTNALEHLFSRRIRQLYIIEQALYLLFLREVYPDKLRVANHIRAHGLDHLFASDRYYVTALKIIFPDDLAGIVIEYTGCDWKTVLERITRLFQ